jgi:hypothetical protein
MNIALLERPDRSAWREAVSEKHFYRDREPIIRDAKRPGSLPAQYNERAIVTRNADSITMAMIALVTETSDRFSQQYQSGMAPPEVSAPAVAGEVPPSPLL